MITIIFTNFSIKFSFSGYFICFRCTPSLTPHILITSLCSISPCHFFCHILYSELRTTSPQLYPVYQNLFTIDCSIFLTLGIMRGQSVVLTSFKTFRLSCLDKCLAVIYRKLHACRHYYIIHSGIWLREQRYLCVACLHAEVCRVLNRSKTLYVLAFSGLHVDV